jgi:DNA-binding MarR family transcriptional regulator
MGANMIAKTLRFFKPNRFLRELLLLLGLDANPSLSQHEIARIADISSSMAHNYVKDFVDKGLLTIQGTTNRTMRYFVTAAGKEHIQELLPLYSEEVVHLYTLARKAVEQKLRRLYEQGLHTAILFGAAETGELVYNAAQYTPLRIIGVVDNDPGKQHRQFGALAVAPPSIIEQLHPDGVIITAFGRPDEIYQDIKYLQERGINIIRL